MRFVQEATYAHDYVLMITFDDGVSKQVDLAQYLEGEIYEPLRSLDYFQSFRVHPDLKTVVWGNHADFSPAFLYEIGKTYQTRQVGLPS